MLNFMVRVMQRDVQGWRKTGCRKSIAIPSDNVCLGSGNGKSRKQRERESGCKKTRREDSINYTKSESSRKGGERGQGKIRYGRDGWLCWVRDDGPHHRKCL